MEEADIRQAGDVMDRHTGRDLVEPIWKAIRGHLEKTLSPINEQLRNYPPPIPACDVQYNHLIEERDRISRELGRLDAACRESLARSDYFEAIDAFIRSSTCIDDEAEQKIRSDSKEAFSDLNIPLEAGEPRRPSARRGSRAAEATKPRKLAIDRDSR